MASRDLLPALDRRALDHLLDTAAHLEPEDPRWAVLGERIAEAIADLIEAGVVAPTLAVDERDPPVVLARLLARVHREFTRD